MCVARESGIGCDARTHVPPWPRGQAVRVVLYPASASICPFVDARRETQVRQVLWTRRCACCDLGKARSGTQNGGQARRLYGNGQVSVSANTTFDHSHYASRAPGPSLVRAVDIRGPRSSLATAARRSANKPYTGQKTPSTRNKNTTSPDYSPRTDSASSRPAASYASSPPAFARQASAAARAPAGPAPRGPPPSEPRGAAPPV